MNIQFPAIVGDIGGTNGRFRLIDSANAPAGPVVHVRIAEHAGLAEALESAMAAEIKAARSLVIAVACPVDRAPFRLTNADWTIDPQAVVARLGLARMVVMNDFMAQGLACAALPEQALERIGGGARDMQAPRAVIGPGTGLGVAQVLRAGGRWLVVPGEGGHLDVGPRTTREFALWPHLEMRGCRLEYEMAISGMGLENLHSGLLKLDGLWSGTSASAAGITALARQGDAHANEAVQLMMTLLARLSGDLALLSLAHGGVYLTGGIMRHVADWARAPQFRADFEDKPPFAAIMARVPLYMVVAEEPGLAGIEAFVRAPDLFDVERSMHVTLGN